MRLEPFPGVFTRKSAQILISRLVMKNNKKSQCNIGEKINNDTSETLIKVNAELEEIKKLLS